LLYIEVNSDLFYEKNKISEKTFLEQGNDHKVK